MWTAEKCAVDALSQMGYHPMVPSSYSLADIALEKCCEERCGFYLAFRDAALYGSFGFLWDSESHRGILLRVEHDRLGDVIISVQLVLEVGQNPDGGYTVQRCSHSVFPSHYSFCLHDSQFCDELGKYVDVQVAGLAGQNVWSGVGFEHARVF